MGFEGVGDHSIGGGGVAVPSPSLVEPAHCLKVWPAYDRIKREVEMWSDHAFCSLELQVLPCISYRGGHMVGDRTDFHFLKLHYWPAILNRSHNYCIPEHTMAKHNLSPCHVNISAAQSEVTYGLSSMLALRSSLAPIHFCNWNSCQEQSFRRQKNNPFTLILLQVFNIISSASCPLEPSTTTLKNLVTKGSLNIEQLASLTAALIGTFT